MLENRSAVLLALLCAVGCVALTAGAQTRSTEFDVVIDRIRVVHTTDGPLRGNKDEIGVKFLAKCVNEYGLGDRICDDSDTELGEFAQGDHKIDRVVQTFRARTADVSLSFHDTDDSPNGPKWEPVGSIQISRNGIRWTGGRRTEATGFQAYVDANTTVITRFVVNGPAQRFRLQRNGGDYEVWVRIKTGS
jgi:hypothetical protein